MLRQLDGTVLFVSHDRFFIDRIATKVWAIEEGEVRRYLGNYTDYQRQVRQNGLAAEPAPAPAPAPVPVAAAPEPPKGSNGRRAGVSINAVQKSLSQAERDIAKLEAKLNELSDALAIAGIDSDVAALERLGAEYARAQDDLEVAYARWEELSAQFELAATP
jgi:ATP-binding cassette subfamily F protein 3